MDMMAEATRCDGTPLSLHGGGTWIGHFWPGVIFFCWGLWWTYHVFRQHLVTRLSGEGRFQSLGWYPAEWRWLRALEPGLKFFGPPLGILVELRLDHPYWLNLLCSEDGSFAMQHIHNYQHASSYPGFIVSGMVDFIGMWVPLPWGTQQVFLALAFFLEGFLMVMHKKHEALDATLHWLLGCTMLAAPLFVLLELRLRNASPLASLGRSFSVMMQGAWLIQMGQMLFTDSVAWKPGPGAQMMAPVAFAMVMLGLAVAMLVLYVCMQAFYQRHAGYTCLPISQTTSLDVQDAAASDSFKHMFGGEDSANEHSDGSEGQSTPPQKAPGGQNHSRSNSADVGGNKQRQLMLALSSLRSGEAKGPHRKRDEHII